MSKVETVKYLYDRFAHGDGAAILATFDPRIEFRLAEGHPYSPDGEMWIGGEAVAKNFFLKSAGEWEAWSIAIEQILEAGDMVVVEARYSGTYKPTGMKLDAQVCHLWRFGGGKVTSFHQYVNTAHFQEIMDKKRERTQVAS